MRIRSASILVFVLALVVGVSPACRTRTKKKAVTPQATPVTETAPPEVAMTVPEPTDFVAPPPPPEPGITSEPLSSDLAIATDEAHQRGWIRDVFFEYDSFALSPDAQDALAVSASWLKSHPQYGLLIEGHCDERGTEQYNLALGDRRANIAREYLATLGVEERRMKTVSYGEERPFEEGTHEGAWRQNRRARLILVAP